VGHPEYCGGGLALFITVRVAIGLDLGQIWALICARRALSLAMRFGVGALPVRGRSCSWSYRMEEVGPAMPPLIGDL
jgi:hypothetical protein